jgi:hypothetical protein
MAISAMLPLAVEVVKKAFFIVVGYFLAKTAMGFVSGAVPQFAGLGNFGIILLGVGLATMTSGPIQELCVGAAVLGAVNVVDTFISPMLMSVSASVMPK